MDRPRAVDLFCGAAAGWSLGLHRAGYTTVAACEIDPWRRAAFASNFPDVRMYADVRDLTAARLAADGIGPIDIIVGSPPCQDASTANTKGRGIDGERTGLFFEAVRLVGELRPAWCCFENVPGLRARGVDRVLAALEGEGYAVWPLVVGARHAGAPHKRDRVWIVAKSNEGGHIHPRENAAKSCGDGAENVVSIGVVPPLSPREQVGRAGQPREEAVGASADAKGRAGRPRPDKPQPEPQGIASILAGWDHWNGGAPDLGRVDDGLPKGMARACLAAYGDSVVPQITEAIARAILAPDRR